MSQNCRKMCGQEQRVSLREIIFTRDIGISLIAFMNREIVKSWRITGNQTWKTAFEDGDAECTSILHFLLWSFYPRLLLRAMHGGRKMYSTFFTLRLSRTTEFSKIDHREAVFSRKKEKEREREGKNPPHSNLADAYFVFWSSFQFSLKAPSFIVFIPSLS